MGKVLAGITIAVDGESLELEHLGVRQSTFAMFIGYRVKSEGGKP
jgi:hypothetical protein